MKLANLISQPVQQIESRKMSAKGIIVPFLVTHLLPYSDDKILKFSLLRWAYNLDATLDAPPQEKAVYLKMSYTL